MCEAEIKRNLTPGIKVSFCSTLAKGGKGGRGRAGARRRVGREEESEKQNEREKVKDRREI